MSSRQRLLVVELWGLGDLALASPFLNAASERYEVTLLAKKRALDFQKRFWPSVEVLPLEAPWTAFAGKYRIHQWPWAELVRVVRRLRAAEFDLGLSSRRDPRDHALLAAANVKRRLGFPRLGSRLVLTDSLPKSLRLRHRYDDWRALADAVGVVLPAQGLAALRPHNAGPNVLIHTGAGQAVKVWPLDRYSLIATRLRSAGFKVQIACDPAQFQWWREAEDDRVVAPATVAELLGLIDQASAFIGNDSGPGHLAALCGVPTLTLFGNQHPQAFAPIHEASEWIEGKPCRYKPCYDSCHFSEPHCILDLTIDEVQARVDQFLQRALRVQPS
jgi:heptosyltransferase-2